MGRTSIAAIVPVRARIDYRQADEPRAWSGCRWLAAGNIYAAGVSFDVSADAYGRFMGRFSDPLATVFADRAGVRAGERALDVGCGPGALTAVLVDRLGATAVTAVDPSASFVAAAQARFPGATVSSGVAEDLPFPDGTFDVTLAQLVVHFMSDPVAGLAEMRRVTRPGGRLGACVWDHAGNAGPLSLFWRAVVDLDPAAPGEANLAGAAEGQLLSLAQAAGWRNPDSGLLTVTVGVSDLRGLVGAVPARRRTGRRVRRPVGPGRPRRAARSLCRTAAGGSVRAACRRLDGPRPRLRRQER